MTVLQDKLAFPGYFVFGEGFHGCHIASWIAIKRPDQTRGIMLASPGFTSEVRFPFLSKAFTEDEERAGWQPAETKEMINHQMA